MMEEDERVEIGKILGSNSQIDYVCEVYKGRDVEEPPSPSDYRFGQFVSVSKQIDEKEVEFIGTIYDSEIVDPDQGRAGPRLSSPEDQELFHPSYVDEKKTLVGVALLGYIESNGEGPDSKKHCVPPWTLEIDDIVSKLSRDEMVSFHEFEGGIELGYYQNLLEIAGPLGKDLLSDIVSRLKEERPEEEKSLSLIEKNLEFKKMIEGV